MHLLSPLTPAPTTQAAGLTATLQNTRIDMTVFAPVGALAHTLPAENPQCKLRAPSTGHHWRHAITQRARPDEKLVF